MAMQMTPAQYRRLVGQKGSDEADGQADRRTDRNTRNRSEGERFQERLDAYHEQLRLTNQATVYRTNPDIRVTAPGRAVIIGKGPVDYIAFLAGGQVVHFDAKSRAGDAFSVATEMAHQVAWLGTMRAYGHVAGLLVWWKDHAECRWHPAGSFEKRVRMRDGYLVVDVAAYGAGSRANEERNMTIKFNKATRPQMSAGGLAGAESRRAKKEAATKIHPLDRMNVLQFEQMLAAKFGPAYLGPVPYRRLEDGRLVPEKVGDDERGGDGCATCA